MPQRWKNALRPILTGLRNSILNIALIGGAQILLALLIWQTLFRSQDQGFSMALTLVGFASWFLSFFMSLSSRRYASGAGQTPLLAGMLANMAASKSKRQPPIDRSGCGCLAFFASLIPLGIAFALRIQADLSAGKTWQDIFPPIPPNP